MTIVVDDAALMMMMEGRKKHRKDGNVQILSEEVFRDAHLVSKRQVSTDRSCPICSRRKLSGNRNQICGCCTKILNRTGNGRDRGDDLPAI